MTNRFLLRIRVAGQHFPRSAAERHPRRFRYREVHRGVESSRSAGSHRRRLAELHGERNARHVEALHAECGHVRRGMCDLLFGACSWSL